ncbi:Ubiquitin carboxyl-terminal hydrolase 47 [Aphanomyces cochlioides]|nr:Ubiquitin carboxyl-terminal hydrolase 47 [Aphanomyces cochlioides]
MLPNSMCLCHHGDRFVIDDTIPQELTKQDKRTISCDNRPLAGDEYHIEILWYQRKPRPTKPSNFLQGGVKPDELTLLMKFIVLNDVMVDKVRAAIAQHFSVKGIHAPYLRLEDYYHRHLNNILIDGFKLNQASTLTPFENRQFVVQILSEPELLPHDHMLYYVSVFDRANFKFGPCQEIIFEYKDRQESWFDILSNNVNEATGIPIESMLFAKPYQTQEVHVLQMEELSWIDREEGRQLLDPRSFGKYADQIVVADGSVPLKKLTKEEQDAMLALVDNSSDEELE